MNVWTTMKKELGITGFVFLPPNILHINICLVSSDDRGVFPRSHMHNIYSLFLFQCVLCFKVVQTLIWVQSWKLAAELGAMFKMI